MAQSAVSLGAADTQANEFDPEPRFESAEVMLADVDMPVGNAYYSDTEDFYADIDDIAAFRDQPGNSFRSTDDQIGILNSPYNNKIGYRDAPDRWARRVEAMPPEDPRSESPMLDPQRRTFDPRPLSDAFFNNNSLLLRSDGRDVFDPSLTMSGSVPGATVLELWAGEMSELARREDAGTISDQERELLDAYRNYMVPRTGYADGGMVSPMDAMGPPTGLDPQLMGDSYEEMPEMGADEADPMAGMDDFMGGVLQIDVFEEVDPVTARSEAFDETLLAPLGAQIELGPRVKAQLDEILGRTGRETYG